MRCALSLISLITLASCVAPAASAPTPRVAASPPPCICKPCPPARCPVQGLRPPGPGDKGHAPATETGKVRPLSTNCQASLELRVEVVRLLVTAAAHATHSSACIDGPGERVTVDDVRICNGRTGKTRLELEASYQVIRRSEGDTRMMNAELARSFSQPKVSLHRAKLTFSGKEGSFRIDLPDKIPGMPGATPLNREHSGGCYGKSGPFKPLEIRHPR